MDRGWEAPLNDADMRVDEPTAFERGNLAEIADMETRGLDERSHGERLGDVISNVASTPAFAVGHSSSRSSFSSARSG